MGAGEAARIVTIAASGGAGLIVGSFLNVVIYRLPRHLSIVRPPSHCPACATRLSALDMVPVISWLVLRGRCRHCHAPISGRYPLVELAAGAGFAAVAAAVASVWAVPSIDVLAACALASAAIDADGSPVPATLVACSLVAAASLAPVAAVLGHGTAVAWAALGAAVAGGATAVVERSSGPGPWRRAAVMATLGWAASWLWPGGGALVAGWVVVAASASVVGAARRSDLAVIVAGGFAMVLVSAAIARV